MTVNSSYSKSTMSVRTEYHHVCSDSVSDFSYSSKPCDNHIYNKYVGSNDRQGIAPATGTFTELLSYSENTVNCDNDQSSEFGSTNVNSPICDPYEDNCANFSPLFNNRYGQFSFVPCHHTNEAILLYEEGVCIGQLSTLCGQYIQLIPDNVNNVLASGDDWQVCKISTLTWGSVYSDFDALTVYLHSTGLEKKFFRYQRSTNGFYELHCDNVLHQDLLAVWNTGYLQLKIFNNNVQGLTLSPYQTFDNYQKDIWAQENLSMTYEQYIHKIIDELCEITELIEASNASNRVDEKCFQLQDQCPDIADTLNELILDTCKDPQLGAGSAKIFSTSSDKGVVSDVLFPDKKTGYISLEYDDDQFVGPDRDEIDVDNIDTCLRIASVIKGTNQPNYKCARFPIKSGLNIRAWEYHLDGYPDKQILQYLMFGFPLSFTENGQLGSKHVTNHYSALAYPEAVTEYLLKEVRLGAKLIARTYIVLHF